MKILVATDNRFWRCALGSQQRISALLEYLLAQGHDIQVLFLGGLALEDVDLIRKTPAIKVQATRKDLVAPPEQSHSSATPRQGIKVYLREGLQALRRLPGEMAWLLHQRYWGMSLRLDLALHETKLADFVRPDDVRQFNALLREWQPDAVLVEYIRLSALVESIVPAVRKQIKVLLDAHDVVSERRLRFHAMNVPHDVDITPAEETARLALYDVILAIQSNDAQIFHRLQPHQKVMIVGHAQYVSQALPPERLPAESVRFMFLGSDMKPNQDAAERLVFSIWPQIQARLGASASLSIAGKVGQIFKDKKLPDGIDINGHINDLDAFYAAHDIFLNPVAFGGGLKIKNVEALAHGLALLTTPVGAEGMHDGTGVFMIESEDQQLAAAAIKLATDKALRTSMSKAALDYANRHFGGAAVYGELDTYLARIISS